MSNGWDRQILKCPTIPPPWYLYPWAISSPWMWAGPTLALNQEKRAQVMIRHFSKYVTQDCDVCHASRCFPLLALMQWPWWRGLEGERADSPQDLKPSVQQPAPKSCCQPQEFKSKPFPSQALRLAQSLGQLGCSLMRTGSGRPS